MPLIHINTIRVENRYRKYLGNLNLLIDSIKTIGLLHPVVVNKDHLLIAGERRLEACKSLGWSEIPATIVALDELRAQHDENVFREPFLPSEAVAIARALEKDEKAKARKRMSEGGKSSQKGIIRGAQFAPLIKGKTRDQLAAYVGMSHTSLQRAEEIVAAAEENPPKFGDLVEEMDGKRRSLSSVYSMLKARQKAETCPVKPSKPSSGLNALILQGDCRETLRSIRSESIRLIITSPWYNVGKEYETNQTLEDYLENMRPILRELRRVLVPDGSLCWEVGNFVKDGEVFPLDIYFYRLFKDLGFKLRNRIAWHRRHGVHATKRFSGRYEVVMWFTNGEDYVFNLDNVRVPQRYPNKTQYKLGVEHGTLSGHPSGANPSDVWEIMTDEWESGLWDIPACKANHPEKTDHPCQFPVEMAERLVLALSDEGDVVLDPFGGTGSTVIAALKHGRMGVMCERITEYVQIARERLTDFANGTLRLRPLGRPVYQPSGSGR
jgi:adenine-specific DNA-methyltransferase